MNELPQSGHATPHENRRMSGNDYQEYHKSPEAYIEEDGVNEDASIDGLEARFIDVGTTRTRYYESGEGEPVLLLHGGSWDGFASANLFSRNIEAFGGTFHVFAPDRIACGMTDNPSDQAEYVYQTEVEHMKQFLDTVGVDDVHIVGHSRGAGLAAKIAVDQPKRVRSLVVLNSNTLGPFVGDNEVRRGRIHRFQPNDPTSPTFFEDRYRHFTEMVTYWDPDKISEEYIKAAAFMRSRQKARETAEIMEDRGQRDIWYDTVQNTMRDTRAQILDGALGCPTLIYWGRNDPTAVWRMGHSLFDIFSQNNLVRMYSVDRAAHSPQREYPDEFNSVIRTFIDTWT